MKNKIKITWNLGKFVPLYFVLIYIFQLISYAYIIGCPCATSMQKSLVKLLLSYAYSFC